MPIDRFITLMKSISWAAVGGISVKHVQDEVIEMLPEEPLAHYSMAAGEASSELRAFLSTHRGFDLKKRREVSYAIKRLDAMEKMLEAVYDYHTSAEVSDKEAIDNAIATVESVTGRTLEEIAVAIEKEDN